MSKAQEEFNRVIQHAINVGTEASVFLHCWNEGDWSGCREFGFEPDLPYESALTALQVRPARKASADFDLPAPNDNIEIEQASEVQLLSDEQITHQAIKVQNFGHLGGEGFHAGVRYAETFYGITKAQS